MNQIFKPRLCHFVLVFFDDILVYNKTWVAHVAQVLQFLCYHQLFLKCSKCAFGASEIEYLGYIVSGEGVCVDPKKIEAMKDWSRPKTLKSLRGFWASQVTIRSFSKTIVKLLFLSPTC